MERSLATMRASRGAAKIGEELRIELLRKGIHLLIAFVPGIARFLPPRRQSQCPASKASSISSTREPTTDATSKRITRW